jgi:hypothetical protein
MVGKAHECRNGYSRVCERGACMAARARPFAYRRSHGQRPAPPRRPLRPRLRKTRTHAPHAPRAAERSGPDRMRNVPRRAQRVTGGACGRTIAQAADHKAKGNEFFKAEKFNEVILRRNSTRGTHAGCRGLPGLGFRCRLRAVLAVSDCVDAGCRFAQHAHTARCAST